MERIEMLEVNKSTCPTPQGISDGDFGEGGPNDRSFPGDHLLCGATELAEFILGDRERARTIYHWFEHGLIPPAFKVGKTICASRAALSHWMRGEEGPAVRVKADTVLWQQ
jgi:hypothetical protein